MLAKTYIFSLSYLLLTGTAWSQLAVFGDLYVSKNNQLHIAFNETYFNGGKIITDNTSVPEAVVSFGPQSDWKQLNRNGKKYNSFWISCYCFWIKYPIQSMVFNYNRTRDGS